MKENIMHWGHTPYEAPEAEVIFVKMDRSFLDSGEKTYSNDQDIPELGDTDMGSIIWG